MAKSDIDARFERDPLEFMKTHTVQPQDYKDRGAQAATPLYDRTPHTYNKPGAVLAPRDSSLALTGPGNLVAYTKLTKADNQYGESKNQYNLFFYSKAVAAVTGVDDYIAAYFLPWTSDHLTRIVIPPKVPTRAGISDALRRQSDPDLFFTAAVNGCSVFVEGDPRHPTVYHAGTTENRSNPGDKNPFVAGNARVHWTRLFDQQRLGGGAYGSVHKDDYVNYLGTGTTPEALQYKAFLESEASTRMKIHSVTAEGSVFGVRDPQGAWAFYLQKNIRFVYTRLVKKKKLLKTRYVPATKTLNKGFSNETVVEDTQTVWAPAQLIKFFPGSAKSPTTARLEPSMVKFILDAY